MRNEIQKLISLGDTEKALALLATRFPDEAAQFSSLYTSGKKQFNMNLIDYSDWQRIQSKVNYSVLELAGQADTGVTPEPVKKGGPSVFISYSWKDKIAAQAVKTFLEKEGCAVTIDDQDIKAGGSIMDFIQNSIKNCDVVLSIVSGNSLQAGWVGGESISAMYAVWLADKKFIPVRLDSVSFDIDFQILAQETLQNNIKELKGKIKKLEQLGGGAQAFRDDLDRMTDLKNNLGKIIQRFNSVLMLDISGEKFDPNMKKIVSDLKA